QVVGQNEDHVRRLLLLRLQRRLRSRAANGCRDHQQHRGHDARHMSADVAHVTSPCRARPANQPRTIGTNCTGIVSSVVTPSTDLRTIVIVCTPMTGPTGAMRMPPTASWSTSACGIEGGAAVRMMRSKGAASGHP